METTLMCHKLDKFNSTYKAYRDKLEKSAEYHECWILRPGGDLCGPLVDDCPHGDIDPLDPWILGFKECINDQWYASYIVGHGQLKLDKTMDKLLQIKPIFKESLRVIDNTGTDHKHKFELKDS